MLEDLVNTMLNTLKILTTFHLIPYSALLVNMILQARITYTAKVVIDPLLLLQF